MDSAGCVTMYRDISVYAHRGMRCEGILGIFYGGRTNRSVLGPGGATWFRQMCNRVPAIDRLQAA